MNYNTTTTDISNHNDNYIQPTIIHAYPTNATDEDTLRSSQHTPTTIDKMIATAKTIKSGTMDLEDFKMAQQTDHYCNHVRENLKELRYNNYSIKQDILTHTDKDNKQTIVLPKSLLNTVLFMHHYTIYAQHKSREKMLQEITKDYYYPNLKNIIHEYTKECYFCIHARNFRDTQQSFGKIPVAEKCRDLWYFDIASGFGTEERTGYKFVYVFVDQLSLHTVLVPAKTKSTEEILEAFKLHIIAHYGIPRALRSDRESGIAMSLEFQDFAASHGIKLLLTAGSSPFSNGIAETKINQLKTNMRAVILATGDTEWSKHIYQIARQINTTQTNYKYSPEELLFGTASTDPKHLLETEQYSTNPETYVKLISDKVQNMRKEMEERRTQHRLRVREYRNTGRTYKQFTEGQLVWISNTIIKDHSALILKRIGPAVIETINKGSSTAQVRNLATQMRTKVHFAHLTPVENETQALPYNWDRNITQINN